MKKANGKECLPQMDASTTCFDKIAHVDANGYDDVMLGGTGVGIPKEYEATYPYRRGTQFQDTKIVLIVKGQEARLYYPTPDVVFDQAVNNRRQANTMTGLWTFDLGGYTGRMQCRNQSGRTVASFLSSRFKKNNFFFFSKF